VLVRYGQGYSSLHLWGEQVPVPCRVHGHPTCSHPTAAA
jgi:hypothetical protein